MMLYLMYIPNLLMFSLICNLHSMPNITFISEAGVFGTEVAAETASSQQSAPAVHSSPLRSHNIVTVTL